VVLVVAAALAVVGLRRVNFLELNQRLIEISELPDSLVAAGFSLSSDRDVTISVAGQDQVDLRTGDGGTASARVGNIWLVNARTGENVWDFRAALSGGRSTDALVYQETVALPEGQYVLYCSAETERQRLQEGSWVDWLDGDGASTATESLSKSDSEEFRITVTGKGRPLSERDIVAALEMPRDTAVPTEGRQSVRAATTRSRNTAISDSHRGVVLADLTRLGDNEARFGQFSLSRTTDVLVYAIGEGSNGEMYDYGWIVNTANGRTVWEMRYRDTEHAGGSSRNRLASSTISLRRGNYVVYFVTDDSHSYEDWDARAPDNEAGWGILVAEASSSNARIEETLPDDEGWTVVAQLTGIRDDVRRRARFTLERRTQVRVYALGEGDRNEMYDFAWVEDAKTRRTIWEMSYRNSEHAGGAAKNRVVDFTGWLPAGEYVLRYESDDSHSPESWNADPPNDQRNYGATIFVRSGNR